MTGRAYCGRFAPSPTGPLHFGSLIAALGSFLDARARAGRWLIRIDDLDTARNAAGAADALLRELERLGLEWDAAPTYQNPRTERYREALDALAAGGHSYPCGCSRREVGPGPYPGTCRHGLPTGRRARSVRLRTGAVRTTVEDRVQGPYVQDLPRAVGDFVVRRADGVVAYHLATVVDDADSGITDVVRGADLLECTPRQVRLCQLLGHPVPRYAHLPVATNARGQKLSKQTHAEPIATRAPGEALGEALAFLGHPVPGELHGARPRDLLAWARLHWSLEAVPPRREAGTAAR